MAVVIESYYYVKAIFLTSAYIFYKESSPYFSSNNTKRI